MAFTTWNPSDKNSNITLTGSNLIATATSGLAGAVRSVSGKRTGKWYVEFTCTTFDSSANTGVGLATAYGPLTNMLGAGSGSPCISVNASGTINSQGTSTGYSIGAVANGDIICMAVDCDNRQVWFRHNGGSWNASSGTAYDPTVNTTGIYFAVLDNYLVFSSNLNSGAVTLNAGATAFTYTVPTGYTSGWDTVDTTGPQTYGSIAKRISATQVATQPGGNTGAVVSVSGRAPTPGPKTVSGTVRVNGVLTGGLLVRCYAKATGELIGQTTTAGDGTYSIKCGANWNDVEVIAFDPTTYQALIYDQVVPA